MQHSPDHFRAACDASFDAVLAALSRPETYAESCAGIDCIETHMSWVFLTEQYAYKLKKPVRLPFLDFSSLQWRRFYCAEEVRLNRRLAEPVYLGVVSLNRDRDGTLRIGGPGSAVEYLVQMRRLPARRMLDSMVRRGEMRRGHIDAVVKTLLAFHRRAPAQDCDGAAYCARFIAQIDANTAALRNPAYALPLPLIEQLDAAQRHFVFCTSELQARAMAGRIIEGHGDLRPEHVYVGPPVYIIDCLEFERALRLLDPIDEMAFLSMECGALGAADVGAALLDRYRASSGDPASLALIRFYQCFRACMRAKLAIWHLDDPAVLDRERWRRRAALYLDSAQAAVRDFADTAQ